MRKIISIMLVGLIFFTACADSIVDMNSDENVDNQSSSSCLSDLNIESEYNISADIIKNDIDEKIIIEDENTEDIQFTGIDDPALPEYIQNKVSVQLDSMYGNQGYEIKQIELTYISNEYIEELEYNSQVNIFFGYTLDEIEQQFQGTRYVFSLGEDGQTIVKEFEEYIDDDYYSEIIKNVAIGTGIIVICVVISVVSAELGNENVAIYFMDNAAQSINEVIECVDIGKLVCVCVDGIENGGFTPEQIEYLTEVSEDYKCAVISGVIKNTFE